MTHFLQSDAWEAFQNYEGRLTHRREGKGWSYLAIVEYGGGVRRLYCPYGPTANSPKALQRALISLRELARQIHAVYVRIQPLGTPLTSDTIRKYRLRQIPYSQPAHTWCIDLTPSADDIIANMKQNNRSIYRNYQKKGLSYSTSTDPNDISQLTTLLHGVAAHNRITIHSDQYFIDQATVFFPLGAAKLHCISLDGTTIAAALTYQDDTTVYYAHAAADHEHRALNASTALLAEIIMQAKADGYQVCDLYGITDSDDTQHRWAGFTRFKKSFGGYEQPLSNTYDFPVKQIRYALYQTIKTII
jgi:lipid II:glycine glycyltransferase (peptidoglycan interpeptide bridge formation enzyme)